MSISAKWGALIEGKEIEIYDCDYFLGEAYWGRLDQLDSCYEDTHSRVSFRVFKVKLRDGLNCCLVLDFDEVKDNTFEDVGSMLHSFESEFGSPDLIFSEKGYFPNYSMCFWLID